MSETEKRARPRRSRKLTPYEQRVRWAEDGDVEQLWGVLATGRWDLIVDMEEVFSLLLKAITVRAERDPAGFAAETFTRMIGFNTYLLMRSQIYINLRLGQHGRSTRALGRPDFSLSAVAELVPGHAGVAEGLGRDDGGAGHDITGLRAGAGQADRERSGRGCEGRSGTKYPERAVPGKTAASGRWAVTAGVSNGSAGSSTARVRRLTGSCTMARTTTSRTHNADLEARWAVIRQKLEAHAEVLASRGSLVAKQARGRRVWAVRFVVAQGGRPIHDQYSSAATRCPSCSSGPGPCWRNTGYRGGGSRKFKAMLGWSPGPGASSGAWPPSKGRLDDHRRTVEIRIDSPTSPADSAWGQDRGIFGRNVGLGAAPGIEETTAWMRRPDPYRSDARSRH